MPILPVDDAVRMNAIYSYQRHIYDLTRKFFLLGRDQLIETLDVPHGGTVLEIGCGTGRNLIHVARRFPTARIAGLDISDAMLSTARKSISRAGLSDRITLAQGDATAFDATALFGHARFDRVFFSYTLSMIPQWRAALMHGVAVCDGRAHIVDFGQLDGWPLFVRRGLSTWLDRFAVEPRAELAEVARSLGRPVSFVPLYRGYAWRLVISR